MRVPRTTVVCAALAVLALCAASPGGGPQAPRSRPLRTGPASLSDPDRCAPSANRIVVRLPAPLAFTTRCGRYEMARDGSVRRTGPPPTRDHRMSIWWPNGVGVGTRGGAPRGRLIIYRNGHALWRSRRSFSVTGTRHYLNAAAVGSRWVAFSFEGGSLWVASRHGAEQPVARGEDPVVWTDRGDLVTSRWHHGETLNLRAPSGRLLRTIVGRTHQFVVESDRSSVLYVSGNQLFRFDGTRPHAIADLDRLGITRLRTEIQLIGSGLIFLQGADEVVVLRPNGRVFATMKARLPRLVPRGSLGPPAAPTADPSGSAVAFVRTRSAPPTVAVYVLPRGGTSPDRVWTHSVSLDRCMGIVLAWHGSRLLFEASRGRTALIDPRTRTAVDLTRAVKRVPGVRRGYGITATAWVGTRDHEGGTSVGACC